MIGDDEKFDVMWLDHGREPLHPPDPRYPEGTDIEIGGSPSCFVKLPYPAKRCGLFIVRCRVCGFSAGVTTAGRPDDPRSVKLPCKAIH